MKPDTERLRELLARVDRIQSDTDDFDGDRRGHYGALEAAKRELRTAAVDALPALLGALAASEDEKHEALNQLDSERHSVAVLEKRVAEKMAALAAAEAKVAELEAKNALLVEALRWYADLERYKPHPHGPAFDRRDIGYVARAALRAKAGD
jgi:chromosome segregation ATPase